MTDNHHALEAGTPRSQEEQCDAALHDPERLAVLYRLGILDTPAEELFDILTRLASRALMVPVAMITLVDNDREFIKSQVGVEGELASRRELPLSHSFCQHMITSGRPLIIEDTRTHPLVHDNPAVEDLNIIAFAGVPLVGEDGFQLGGFCATDSCPRTWTEKELEMLENFSALVVRLLELRLCDMQRRAIYENISDVVLLVNSSGNIEYVSESVTCAVGSPRDELVGQNAFELLHPDDRAQAESAFTVTLANQGMGPLTEARIRHRDGSYRWFEMACNNRIEDPNVGAVVVTARDITGWKAQHLELERLAAIVDSSNDAIIGVTLDGLITSWNAAAERLYGYTATEIVGRPIEKLTPSGKPSDAPQLLGSIARGERVVNHETKRQSKGGRIIDAAVTISPVRDGGGKVVGGSSIVRDVTERNHLLEERNRLHDELHEEFLRTAEVQAQLLPSTVPNIADYAFAAVCLPAREVGGDFYDWSNDENAVRLSLGDVMGKGMPAALLMATARAALRSVGHLPVAEAISSVNRALAPDLKQSDAFVTLFHAELHRGGALQFVDAGHGMALILRGDGSFDSLHRGNLPLGIIDDAPYRPETTQLDSGDTLIIYSDGLPDARPDLRLDPAGVAAQCSGIDDLHAMLEHLVSLALAGQTQPDDLTLLLVRHQEKEA